MYKTLLALTLSIMLPITAIWDQKNKELKNNRLIYEAQRAYHKALHTFAHEFVLMHDLPQEKKESINYLRAYIQLTTYIDSRAERLSKSYSYSQSSIYIFSSPRPFEPLTNYLELLTLTLKKVAYHRTKLKEIKQHSTLDTKNLLLEPLISQLDILHTQLLHLYEVADTYVKEYEANKKVWWKYTIISLWIGAGALAALRMILNNIIIKLNTQKKENI